MRLLPKIDSFSVSQSILRIHRDDVEHIEDLLRAGGLTLTYKDDTYEYDTLDELIQRRGTTPKDFEIQANSGGKFGNNLTVYFYRDRIRVYALYPENLGVIPSQITDVLRSLGSRGSWIFNPGLWSFVFLLGWAPSWLGYKFAVSGLDSSEQLRHLGFAGVVFGYAIQWGYCGIHLTRKHEGGFFKRNADKIWLLLIGTVIGSVVTHLFTVLGHK